MLNNSVLNHIEFFLMEEFFRGKNISVVQENYSFPQQPFCAYAWEKWFVFQIILLLNSFQEWPKFKNRDSTEIIL